MRYLDVTTDYAFKRVFGSPQSKPILISFLNALLQNEGPHAIADLEIVDPYLVPVIEGMKDTFVDVKAVLANGSRIIVEMQVLNTPGFEQRILYNAAKNYAQQLAKGQQYTLLNPVIAVTLTDFVMFDDSDAHVSRFKLLEQQRLTKYTDDLELVFVELPKFGKTEADLATMEEFWLYFIKHSSEMDSVPARFAADPALLQAFEMAEESKLSLAELEMQHRRFDFIRLQRGSIEKAGLDGEARGRGIGLVEGRAEGKAEGLELALQRLIAAGVAEDKAREMLGMVA